MALYGIVKNMQNKIYTQNAACATKQALRITLGHHTHLTKNF